VDDVEARFARGEFDDDLLALLLLRNLLRFNLDAGQIGEFLGVFLQIVARAAPSPGSLQAWCRQIFSIAVRRRAPETMSAPSRQPRLCP